VLAVPLEAYPIDEEPSEPSKQKSAEKRNFQRISDANKRDEVTLGEYLSEDINDVLPEPIHGPNDSFDPGEEFLKKLTEVATTDVEPPRPAPIVFKTSPEALQANDHLLKSYSYDLERLFADFQDTTLGYGSEFRPLDQLEKVLGGHPEFEALAGLVRNGMDYRFKTEISESERLRELQGMLERGNHKSTEKESDKATELLAKDVAHGFSIPISPETVEKVKGAMVQPLGLTSQFTLAADGSRKIKNRLTQDLTFIYVELQNELGSFESTNTCESTPG
jgi:hypothetical protein